MNDSGTRLDRPKAIPELIVIVIIIPSSVSCISGSGERKFKSTPKLDYTALRCNANTRQDFLLCVQNRFEVLKHEKSNTWDAFKKASVTTEKAK